MFLMKNIKVFNLYIYIYIFMGAVWLKNLVAEHYFIRVGSSSAAKFKST